MTPYRCETCKFLTKEPVEWGFDPYCHISVPIKLDNWEWVKRWGCASHSDFQNQREKVLDEFYQKLFIRNHIIHPDSPEGKAIKMMLDKLRQSKGGE
jgi:hypothetical protein